HTRCLSDWSSDVCSSDLAASLFAILDPSLLAYGFRLSAFGSRLHRLLLRNRTLARSFARARVGPRPLPPDRQAAAMPHAAIAARSEERRVGQPCRARSGP